MSLLSFVLILNAAVASTYITSLSDARTVKLDSLTKNKTVAILFQKDCSVCKKQIKDLKCLEDKFNILIMGAFSSENTLRQEYQKMSVSYPAYYASADILKALKINSSATPQIISFSEKQTTIYLGYKECNRLKKSLLKTTEESLNDSI